MSATSSIVDRTLANLRSAWRGITLVGRSGKALSLRPDLPDKDCELLREQMRRCLEGHGGEVSAKSRAAVLGQAYLDLDNTGRKRFLEILARDFQVDRAALTEALQQVNESAGLEQELAFEARLREMLSPPRLKLMMQFNALPQGVKFLVDLRADLRSYSRGDPLLASMDQDLKGLLSSWFDIGFLDLKRITWDAPASLLERLMSYEAVHEIHSWENLKHRLNSDRRCYAYFHPRMPDEPLIFVQVALVSGISDNVHDLLDESKPSGDPQAADTAIFYSISNTQKGLEGVNLGNFLIKRVVDDLARDLPKLKNFATLSPVPGFRDCLAARLKPENESQALNREEVDQLEEVGCSGSLIQLLERPDWYLDDRLCQAARGPLMRLCADYLVNEKRNGRALNRVANFHLSNGARIERINWLADVSPKGLAESAGLMVNYLYKLSEIEKNHEAYHESSQVVVSNAVSSLLK